MSAVAAVLAAAAPLLLPVAVAAAAWHGHEGRHRMWPETRARHRAESTDPHLRLLLHHP